MHRSLLLHLPRNEQTFFFSWVFAKADDQTFWSYSSQQFGLITQQMQINWTLNLESSAAHLHWGQIKIHSTVLVLTLNLRLARYLQIRKRFLRSQRLSSAPDKTDRKSLVYEVCLDLLHMWTHGFNLREPTRILSVCIWRLFQVKRTCLINENILKTTVEFFGWKGPKCCIFSCNCSSRCLWKVTETSALCHRSTLPSGACFCLLILVQEQSRRKTCSIKVLSNRAQNYRGKKQKRN